MNAPFEWDSENEAHIARHAVTRAEAEQTLADLYRTPLQVYVENGERRQASLGVTESGRLLFIVVTMRAGNLRVVTAYTASRRVGRLYRGPRR